MLMMDSAAVIVPGAGLPGSMPLVRPVTGNASRRPARP